MHKRERGFTLIEMMVALLIVSLMIAGTALLTSRILPRWRLREAATDVAAAVQAARARAVIEQATVVMAFDTTRGLYVLHSEVSGGATARQTDYTGSSRWYGALPRGVTFARPDVGRTVTLAPLTASTESAAVFDSGGILRSTTRPGDVYLGITGQGLYRRVRVTLAGTVQIQSWNGLLWR